MNTGLQQPQELAELAKLTAKRRQKSVRKSVTKKRQKSQEDDKKPGKRTGKSPLHSILKLRSILNTFWIVYLGLISYFALCHYEPYLPSVWHVHGRGDATRARTGYTAHRESAGRVSGPLRR